MPTQTSRSLVLGVIALLLITLGIVRPAALGADSLDALAQGILLVGAVLAGVAIQGFLNRQPGLSSPITAPPADQPTVLSTPTPVLPVGRGSEAIPERSLGDSLFRDMRPVRVAFAHRAPTFDQVVLALGGTAPRTAPPVSQSQPSRPTSVERGADASLVAPANALQSGRPLTAAAQLSPFGARAPGAEEPRPSGTFSLTGSGAASVAEASARFQNAIEHGPTQAPPESAATGTLPGPVARPVDDPQPAGTVSADPAGAPEGRLSGQQLQALFQQFVTSARALGLAAERVTFPTFEQHVRTQEERILDAYPGATVVADIKLRDGQPRIVLRPSTQPQEPQA